MQFLRDRRQQLVEQNKSTMERMLRHGEPIYLFGCTRYTDIVIERLATVNQVVSGILDDHAPMGEYKSIPILSVTEVNPESVVISCVLDGRLITALDRLLANGFHFVLSYLDLHLHDPVLFPAPQFQEGNMVDIDRNRDNYEWLYLLLSDEVSKETLVHLLDFRYNFDAQTMRNFDFAVGSQYFDVLPVDAKGIFVDCGGFDGETSRKYMELDPHYEQVHIFEPSPDTFRKMQGIMSEYPRVFVYPYATFSSHRVVAFDSSGDSSSMLDRNGNVDVQAVRLDDVIDRASIIKMDVEGSEYETLRGAERIIKTCRPKLAVCVYHAQEHFWRIPELILSYRPDYRVYLRHYTEGLLETVMYFL